MDWVCWELSDERVDSMTVYMITPKMNIFMMNFFGNLMDFNIMPAYGYKIVLNATPVERMKTIKKEWGIYMESSPKYEVNENWRIKKRS